MMTIDSNLDRKDRNIYIRYILNMLVETYLINQAQLAYRLGVQPKYLREFANGVRNFSNKKLDEFEELITELYQPLLCSELPTSEYELSNLLDFLRLSEN